MPTKNKQNINNKKNKQQPKSVKSKGKPKNQKVNQKGGNDGKCSNKGPRMVKPDPPNHRVFQTGQTYGSEDKNATDWSNTLNMSSLYPGLPPKPPLESCIIM